MKETLHAISAASFDEVQSIRRYLHMHPELSREEEQTALFIGQKLTAYGIPFQKGVGGHGVVALITGKNPGSRCVALRADMDALPLTEGNKTSYTSVCPGKMHACGHDVHMACLLGAGKILSGLREQMEGTVKLLFQPSEETYPGGAISMINEGVLKNPDVEIVIGQHVLPTLDVGKVGFTPGKAMASTDEIFLVIKGRGGHAAHPEQVIDPVAIAAHVIVALQHIVSRESSPLMPTVLSFGRIIGEGRTNIIPDEVTVDGTLRTYDEAWRKTIHQRVGQMASAVAESMGGSCDVKVSPGYPFLHNDEKITNDLTRWAQEYLGDDKVEILDSRMTAEDFAYFAQQVPSCLFRLGVRDEGQGFVSGLHSTTFDVDERALITGTGLLAWFAVNLLKKEQIL